MQTDTSVSTVLNSPKSPSRKWLFSVSSLKLPRMRTYSLSMNSMSPSRSLLSLSPSKLWRRRRESTASFMTVSESSTLSTPSTPSKSSRPLPVRSYTVCRFNLIPPESKINLILRHQPIKNGHDSQRRYLTDKEVPSTTYRNRRCQLNLHHQPHQTPSFIPQTISRRVEPLVPSALIVQPLHHG